MILCPVGWDPAPPSTRQRIAAGAFIAAFGGVLANEYLGWHVFGSYGRLAVGVVALSGVIMMTYFMPSTRRR